MPEEDAGLRTAAFWSTSLFLAGLLTLAMGGFVLVASSGYGRGTVLRMGPGFFPAMLGGVLLVLGTLLLVSGFLGTADRISRPEIRAPLCIGIGIALFALTLPRYGLAPAIALLVPISACASPNSRPLPTIVLVCALTGFTWLVFVVLLSMPLPMLAW
jgi:hypothetical protein